MALVWNAVLRARSLDPGLSKSIEENAARGQIGRWLLCESQYPPVIEILTGAEFGALLIVDEQGEGSVGSLVYHFQTARGFRLLSSRASTPTTRTKLNVHWTVARQEPGCQASLRYSSGRSRRLNQLPEAMANLPQRTIGKPHRPASLHYCVVGLPG